MIAPNVQHSQGVTLVGGGALGGRDLRLALARAPMAVAADSGADRLLAAGILPDAVIGDFDSISSETMRKLPADRLHPAPAQDRTDFVKALQRIKAPLVLAVGFTGARMDHGLAVMNGLVLLPNHRCIVIGPKDIAFAAPPELALRLCPDDPLSLFPMTRLEGSSEGLHWPLQGLEFAPDAMIGTSNKVARPEVRMSFNRPGMLTILPRKRLDAAIKALAAAPFWPESDGSAAHDR
ncbi:thiamine diphosphokinase [Xinfangfangia sp. CPCC 101601]|uniref:Thiamine diphosphokinase n=1 Tax=Pseudogemmobacter lacusdianii TaxID=3069608 RepID=A0ABU0VVH9_9RHOB|nr:thiamine diphosphokinase [Xinfangfangia sp. CPCC 101601]MDQ2065756.1 thiamine diphosphokinase [Xinfangfangia sp. CPCC 101601]